MKIVTLRCLALLLASACCLAAALITAEKVQFTGGQLLVWPGGQVLVSPDEAALPLGIIVRTNGSFTVAGGKTRALQEGEIISADGMLAKPNGAVVPVLDHVTSSRGKVMMIKDGEAAELLEALTLGDGTVVTPDGKIAPRGKSERRLLDGELFKLDGTSLPARDTITMQNGQVIVQKDGSRLKVDTARSITLNDGTKVFGDGTVIKTNGEKTAVMEGKVITLEGVVTRPR